MDLFSEMMLDAAYGVVFDRNPLWRAPVPCASVDWKMHSMSQAQSGKDELCCPDKEEVLPGESMNRRESVSGSQHG